MALAQKRQGINPTHLVLSKTCSVSYPRKKPFEKMPWEEKPHRKKAEIRGKEGWDVRQGEPDARKTDELQGKINQPAYRIGKHGGSGRMKLQKSVGGDVQSHDKGPLKQRSMGHKIEKGNYFPSSKANILGGAAEKRGSWCAGMIFKS